MIMGLFGHQGDGKTLMMMMLARHVQAKLGGPIYTNVRSFYGDVIRIDRLSRVSLERDQPKVLAVDEAMFSLDARLFAGRDNLTFSQFLAFLRKAGFLFMYSTHYPMMVEQRLRLQTQYAIFALGGDGRYFSYDVYDVRRNRSVHLQVPKGQRTYDFAGFNTLDFPPPIKADIDFDLYSDFAG